MKNMNNKTKKWLTVAGGLAMCAMLVVLIGTQLQKDTVKDDPLPPQSSQVSDVTVETPTAEKEKEVVVTPPEIPASSQPTNNGAISSGTEQTIQADPVKPDYTEEQLKDPTQKPSGEKVTEPPKSEEHDTVTPPAEPPKQSNQPQGGDTKDGMIYAPGFGWIKDVGEGHGTVVDGDGDINKQVGIMD